MSVLHKVGRWLPPLSALLFVAILCVPGPAGAGDYARNDVSKRKLNFVAMELPSADQTIALMAHGSMSQQIHHLYLGAETLVGSTVEGRPVIGVGLFVGLDAAADAWTPVSMYAQVGSNLLYTFRGIQDLLVFHLETGLRFLVSSHSSPLCELQVGVRVGTSLQHTNVAFVIGGGLSYD